VHVDAQPLNRAGDIAAAGVRGVVHVHGVDDGLVPYNQTQEMVRALDRVDVVSEVHTIVRRGDGESGTTVTGTALGAVVPGYQSPFAGHASERSTTHEVMRVGFGRLAQLLDEDREVTCNLAVLVHGDGDSVYTNTNIC
jgi:hypothetical protein